MNIFYIKKFFFKFTFSFGILYLSSLFLSPNYIALANPQGSTIEPKQVYTGDSLTYTIEWLEQKNSFYYFGKSWDKNWSENNPMLVKFNENGVLKVTFSAPANEGRYRVFIYPTPEGIKRGSYEYPQEFTVIKRPTEAPAPNPVPTSTPVPTPPPPTLPPAGCPVCKDGYVWNDSYQTCQNIKDTTQYANPVRYESCSESQHCSLGKGCVKPVLPNPPCTSGPCKTAIGDIDVSSPINFITQLFRIILGSAGGIALILFLYAGYILMTSRGDKEKIQGARETITSAIAGLLFIIFAIAILEFIGVDILGLPGFGR